MDNGETWLRKTSPDLIKIRVTGPVDSVREIAIALENSLNAGERFTVKEMSDLYRNRPPQEHLGRVYLDVLAAPARNPKLAKMLRAKIVFQRDEHENTLFGIPSVFLPQMFWNLSY